MAGVLLIGTIVCACCCRKRKAYTERFQRRLVTSTPSVSRLVESSLTEDRKVEGETTSKIRQSVRAILGEILVS